ncbi:nucleotidyltransferase family protein [Niveibacterium sp. SC-1]|uniref:nucleotidyltransferase family protein n=1 Tax=Niveibacterium sp. SC-1 TaxID=3135646 RepID=UPI00311D6666
MPFSSRHDALSRRLISLVRAHPHTMAMLAAVRELDLRDWCIGAGAIRNLVWDALHGHIQPTALADVDVAYFDAADLSPKRDAALQGCLCARMPQVPWEVTNQAAVHLWFEDYFGHPVAPLASLEEAVASWPEYATAVGLRLEANDTITVIAPHGLEDLFGLIVRRNPARASIETYRERIAQKQYAQRWPGVTILPS